MIERTPYGALDFEKDTIDFSKASGYDEMAKEGYIFVFQDIRGKYKSEGKWRYTSRCIMLRQKDAIDESTDTYDTVDWLIKNIPDNNGKAGIVGFLIPAGWHW